jgi:hypothetical protein
MPIEFNQEHWDELVKQVVTNECVPRMDRLAGVCNSSLRGRDRPFNPVGYVVDVKVPGGKTLEDHDYRATCITATTQAMADNAENNTLVMNFHQAGGDT